MRSVTLASMLLLACGGPPGDAEPREPIMTPVLLDGGVGSPPRAEAAPVGLPRCVVAAHLCACAPPTELAQAAPTEANPANP